MVSGALDWLHYETDPCVKFDSDWKLWTYLHADRTMDDFKVEEEEIDMKKIKLD